MSAEVSAGGKLLLSKDLRGSSAGRGFAAALLARQVLYRAANFPPNPSGPGHSRSSRGRAYTVDVVPRSARS